MSVDSLQIIGSVGDLWLFGDPDFKAKQRARDFAPGVVANYACQTCGAQKGVLCRRWTLAGRFIPRRLSHFGRGRPGRFQPKKEIQGRKKG